MDERNAKKYKMNLEDLKIFSKKIKGKLEFDFPIKNLNWFNIGGNSKLFFRPDTLSELIEFLKIYDNRGKIFVLGAGSNILFSDNLFNGVVIKLSKNFQRLTLLNKNTIVAGSGVLDKKLSEFAEQNNLSGFEFLSCIPGTVGGGVRMNSGCFDNEFKDILISLQALDFLGNIITIPVKKIKFSYRTTDLPNNLIFLSATLQGNIQDNTFISKLTNEMKKKKNISQPSKIKTGGSTFKNPKEQTNKKVWELIQENIQLDVKYGDASISKKHCNFFVNENKAKFDDMKKLINHVKNEVKNRTGIEIETEVIIVE